MFIKKFKTSIFFALIAVIFTFGLTACAGKNLSAPEITLTDNVISWNAVSEADSYEVYEQNELVSTQSQTTYTIKKSAPGTYSYKVRAARTDGSAVSGFSNAVEYVLNSDDIKPLSAPVLTISGNVISWEAVEHASVYEIYWEEKLVARQPGLSYTLNHTAAGEYTYYVKAVSSDARFTPSEAAKIIYKVEPQAVTRLSAPVLSLVGKVISWEPVEHASGYIILKDGDRVCEQKETSYTPTETIVDTYTYVVIATSSDAAYSTSERSNPIEFTVDPTPLAAPHISLSGENVIVWEPVENAESYIIYRNNKFAAQVNSNTYFITINEVGDYSFYVIATTDNKQYSKSAPSNTLEYTYIDKREPLATPQVTKNGNTLSWEIVEEADYYDVYENGIRIVRLSNETTSYELTRRTPGKYVYNIAAVDSDGVFKSSDFSTDFELEVAESDITYNIAVNAPADFKGANLKVGLYKDDALVGSANITLKDGNASASIVAKSGEYRAKIIGELGADYGATQAQIDSDNNLVSLSIVKFTSKLRVGVNSFRVTDGIGIGQDFQFVAEKTGMYNITVNQPITVWVSGLTVIDNGLSVFSWYMEKGELIEISVAAQQSGSFSFNIKEGEQKEELKISTENNPNVNGLNAYDHTFKRYITLEEKTTFRFEFYTASLGNRLVAILINGEIYNFTGPDEELRKNIDIGPGEDIEIEIIVIDNGGGSEGLSIQLGFAVYEV